MSESLQLVERAAPVGMSAAPQMSFTPEQVQLIKNTIAKGANDDELSLFMNIAQRTGLDPFARQIFYIKRWDAAAGREVGQPQTSIDGYRLIAERTGCYCPGRDPEFSLAIDGFLLSATAFIKKWVRGEWHEVSATAYWEEYAQKKKDGSLTQMWHRMPRTMLAKCAEALALRKAFPAELSGLYTREEMMQAESEYEPPPPKPIKPAPPKPEPKPEPQPMTPIAEVIEAELVTPSEPAPEPAIDDAAVIKRITWECKFASSLSLWQQFQWGLLGCPTSEASAAQLATARSAMQDAALNPDIVRWNSESWACSSEYKTYLMGLIIAHAHQDGFEKTKAIVGDPAKLNQFRQIETRAHNLLSWVRPDELQRLQEQKQAA